MPYTERLLSRHGTVFFRLTRCLNDEVFERNKFEKKKKHTSYLVFCTKCSIGFFPWSSPLGPAGRNSVSSKLALFD